MVSFSEEVDHPIFPLFIYFLKSHIYLFVQKKSQKPLKFLNNSQILLENRNNKILTTFIS